MAIAREHASRIGLVLADRARRLVVLGNLKRLFTQTMYADDVYAYLGGPDDLHSDAWKNLQPGRAMKRYRLPSDASRGTSRMRWMPSHSIAGLSANAIARTAIGAPSSSTTT